MRCARAQRAVTEPSYLPLVTCLRTTAGGGAAPSPTAVRPLGRRAVAAAKRGKWASTCKYRGGEGAIPVT